MFYKPGCIKDLKSETPIDSYIRLQEHDAISFNNCMEEDKMKNNLDDGIISTSISSKEIGESLLRGIIDSPIGVEATEERIRKENIRNKLESEFGEESIKRGIRRNTNALYDAPSIRSDNIMGIVEAFVAFNNDKAIQFKGNFTEIEDFCGGDANFVDDKVVVATPKGPLYLKPNDWIVKTKDNAFYTLEASQWLVTGVDWASGEDFTTVNGKII